MFRETLLFALAISPVILASPLVQTGGEDEQQLVFTRDLRLVSLSETKQMWLSPLQIEEILIGNGKKFIDITEWPKEFNNIKNTKFGKLVFICNVFSYSFGKRHPQTSHKRHISKSFSLQYQSQTCEVSWTRFHRFIRVITRALQGRKAQNGFIINFLILRIIMITYRSRNLHTHGTNLVLL